jgi:pimeloyl-ACP methyl ester carboxylesterase
VWALTNLKGVLRSFGESNLFGERYGAGPVQVVWLHGWGRKSEDFARAASALAEKGVTSVALDLPGFGASPPPVVAGGARHYSELVLPALAEISKEPLVIVGHSFGGTVATVLASSHPELVHGLVLSGAPLVRAMTTRKSSWRYRLVRALNARGLISDQRIEAARQKYGSTDYRVASGVMRQVLVASVNESYDAELANLSVPVTMVWGENDHDVPVDVARRAAALLTSVHDLRVLDDVGHFVPLEAPGALVNAVEGMLEQ